jgi:Enterobacter phage Enc34, ssDNA-binding protein
MAYKKIETIPYVTSWFRARWPKLSKPDTEGTYPDNKFKTDAILLSDEDYAAAEAAFQAAAKKLWPDVENVSLPLKPFYDNAEDKKAKKNPIGRGFTLKSKKRPAVFDSRKKKLPDSVEIGPGSIIRVAAYIFPWSKTEKVRVKNADGTVTEESETAYGISLRLSDVQVRELVAPSSSGTGAAFDEDDEGFTYDGDDSESAGDKFGTDASPTDL